MQVGVLLALDHSRSEIAEMTGAEPRAVHAAIERVRRAARRMRDGIIEF